MKQSIEGKRFFGAMILLCGALLCTKAGGGELRDVDLGHVAVAPKMIDAAGYLFNWSVMEQVDDDVLMTRVVRARGPWPEYESVGHGSWLKVSGETVALNSDGELYEWGLEGINGVTFPRKEYVPFQRVAKPDGVSEWRDFAACSSIKAAIGDDGELYVWGPQRDELFTSDSLEGPVIGRGLRRVARPAGVDHWVKTEVNEDTPLLKVSTGGGGAAACSVGSGSRLVGALGNNGIIYLWGYTFEQTPTGYCPLLSSDQNYYRINLTRRSFVPPSGVDKWMDFSLGSQSILATGSDGVLYSWGSNSQGQLGVGLQEDNTFPYTLPVSLAPKPVKFPDGVTHVKSFSTGWGDALAIGDNGQVYWWGQGGIPGGLYGITNLIAPADFEREIQWIGFLGMRPVALRLPSELGSIKSVHAGFWNLIVDGEHGKFYDCWNNAGMVVVPAMHTDPPTNYPPFVRMRSPLGDYTFPNPTNVTLKAEAIDVDGTIASVQFLIDGTPVGEAQQFTNDVYHLDLPLISYGRHEIRARAIDDQGNETTSDPALLQVQSRVWMDELSGQDMNEPVSPSERVAPSILRLHRDGDIGHEMELWFELSGAAKLGQDYLLLGPVLDVPTNSTLKRIIFPAGASEVALGIEPLFDDTIEGKETLIMRWFDSPTYRFDPSTIYSEFTIADGYLPASGPPQIQILQPTGQLAVASVEQVPFEFNVTADHAFVRRIEIHEGQYLLWSTNYSDYSNGVALASIDIPIIFSRPGTNEYSVSATDSAGRVATTAPGTVDVTSLPHPWVIFSPLVGGFVPEGYDSATAFNPIRLYVQSPVPRASPLTVEFEYSGTATPGRDYVALPSEITIAADQNYADIPLMILRDDKVEPLETLTITPVSHVCTDPAEYDPALCYRASGAVTFTIYDQPVSTTTAPPDGNTNVLQLRFVRELGPAGHWLEINGASGSSLWLESSKDLQSWSPVQKVIDPVNGFQFLDWNQPQADRRFYRLRSDGGGQ